MIFDDVTNQITDRRSNTRIRDEEGTEAIIIYTSLSLSSVCYLSDTSSTSPLSLSPSFKKIMKN